MSRFLGIMPPECNQCQRTIFPISFFGASPSAQFPSHSPAFAGSLAPFRDHPDKNSREYLDCPDLEDQYHYRVRSALTYAYEIEDFDNLVDPRTYMIVA
nr:hypothetical protein CFP56_58050 [Quercus suber]